MEMLIQLNAVIYVAVMHLYIANLIHYKYFILTIFEKIWDHISDLRVRNMLPLPSPSKLTALLFFKRGRNLKNVSHFKQKVSFIKLS